jgi:hypothetical protein
MDYYYIAVVFVVLILTTVFFVLRTSHTHVLVFKGRTKRDNIAFRRIAGLWGVGDNNNRTVTIEGNILYFARLKKEAEELGIDGSYNITKIR